MRVETIGQTDHFAGYAGSAPEQQSASRAVQSIGAAGILVPALWSAIGLALSALFVSWLSDAMAADDTFNFLARLLG
jgi:hypothetical protein